MLEELWSAMHPWWLPSENEWSSNKAIHEYIFGVYYLMDCMALCAVMHNIENLILVVLRFTLSNAQHRESNLGCARLDFYHLQVKWIRKMDRKLLYCLRENQNFSALYPVYSFFSNPCSYYLSFNIVLECGACNTHSVGIRKIRNKNIQETWTVRDSSHHRIDIKRLWIAQ